MNAFRWMRRVALCVSATALLLAPSAAPAAAARAAGATIRSVMNNKCLEIYAFNNNNGADVVTWDCWGGANQHWYRDGQQIRSVMNHKCLEIYAFNNNNGAQVVTWDCWGGANQHWY
jgi:hypothetical protein